MAVAPAAQRVLPRTRQTQHSWHRQPLPAGSVSVVIPAKNEAGNLPWVLPRIPDLVDEIILVDGLSTDETVAVAKMVRSDVVVIHETRPGKGSALRAGFAAARGEYVIMLDADCSMDPAEIPAYVDKLRDGYDMVKGSRFMKGGGTDDMTLLRRAGNFGLLLLANQMYGSDYSDLCYGFLGFHASLLRQVDLDVDGFEVEMQLIARATRAGARIGEVASFEARRLHGQSNLRTFPDGWRILRTMVREMGWKAKAEELSSEHAG